MRARIAWAGSFMNWLVGRVRDRRVRNLHSAIVCLDAHREIALGQKRLVGLTDDWQWLQNVINVAL